jgi:hypothetical protein
LPIRYTAVTPVKALVLYSYSTLSHRFQFALSEVQYRSLSDEANRSSVSVAELIRRAIDTTYGPDGETRVHVITHTLGRRSGVRLSDYASPSQ